MARTRAFLLPALAAAALTVAAAPSRADSVADFYRGKTVTIVVPVSAGGVYGTMAQILERHIARYIPGNPSVIVQYMEGAGGIKGLNHVYNVAPQDGTQFITPTTGIVATAVLEPAKVRYDVVKFNYLGGWGEAVAVMTVMNTAPVKTLQEVLTTEVVLGAIGKGTSSYQIPAMLNDMLDTKFKIITGYQGGSPIRLAMEKGEVHGWCGVWLGWRAIAQDWIRDKKIVHLFQAASKRQSDLADVPLLTELAQTDEQRAVFEFMSSLGLTGQTMVAPPNVPADRLAAMEKAYMATLNDPGFRKDAESRNYPIDPLTAAEVRTAVQRIAATPPAVIDRAKKAMGM